MSRSVLTSASNSRWLPSSLLGRVGVMATMALLLLPMGALAPGATASSADTETGLGPATVWSRNADGTAKGPILRSPNEGPAAPGEPPPVAGRSGLHFSAAEVAVWRERAVSGPYRRAGDAGVNTPGDWDRVVGNAKQFLADPSFQRWSAPTHRNSSGCVDRRLDGSNDPPRVGATRLRDAAFYYLVTGETAYRDAVRAELLAQAAVPSLDWSQKPWCTGVFGDGDPSFGVANWLTKLLYAYDYLGPDSFTAAQRQTLNRWFYDAASFWQHDLNANLDRLFVNRWNGNYSLTSTGSNTSTPKTGYYGSKPIYSIHRFYNNRKATVARFVGMAALKLTNEDYTAPTGGMSVGGLRKTAQLWVKEWLAYGVFPEGFFGEFERWTSSAPSRGWGYSASVLASTMMIADGFARAGDTSLYDYATTAGALGSQSSQPKTLLWAAQSLGRHTNGHFQRYGTDQASRNGNSNYVIGSIEPLNNWRSLNDIQVAVIDRYYNNAFLRSMYLRQGNNMPPYPSNPAISGQHVVWTGDWGTLPATLFMHAQMEHVKPY